VNSSFGSASKSTVEALKTDTRPCGGAFFILT